ncbi:MAG: TetR/AcrR family transcriptional regulator [Saprospiraceae bacterium]|nr:TetR/AcrR family transcriptional regulator [Saprospiraceae bacterium]
MGKHSVRFDINSNLFLRDPQGSEYGQKLLKNSIVLLDELGFEAFTFKKLAQRINSTEASIYRYFQNKHVLLLYLTNWYWEWVSYLIDINTMNIDGAEEQLKIVIHNIVNASTESPLTEYINENVLHQIIINEGSKAYHIHDVDDENKDGFFQSYKELVNKVSDLIVKFAPNFPYPKLLASNLFEMANNQIYFAEHLPRLTDIKNRAKKYKDLEDAMNFMAFKLLAD